jgi:hypothetical protein
LQGLETAISPITVVCLATRQKKINCEARKHLFHPSQWSIWPPDEGKLAARPGNSYFTHHRGPFGHPTKENKLRGPETAISPITVVHLATQRRKISCGARKKLFNPSQWSIWPPDEGKLAVVPKNSYLTITVVNLATRQRKISCEAWKQLFHPSPWSIWPPVEGKLAEGPGNSYFTHHSGPFGHPTKEN